MGEHVVNFSACGYYLLNQEAAEAVQRILVAYAVTLFYPSVALETHLGCYRNPEN